MKLFKAHAVMPRVGHEPTRVVRTYVVIARTWQEARARIWTAEGVEFVTIPGEMADVLMTGVTNISEREFEDLRSACAWREYTGSKGRPSEERGGKLDDRSRPEKSR
jgi:hypothetical protein